MENKKYYYIKLKENFFDSDQMLLLESSPDGFLYSNILLKLYLRSLRNEGKLMVNDKIPYSLEMLSAVVKQPQAVVKHALDMFVALGLVEILDNGAIYMMDIQGFIGHSSTEGERKAEYRKRIAKDKESSKEIENPKSLENRDRDRDRDYMGGTNLGQCPTKKSKKSNKAVEEWEVFPFLEYDNIQITPKKYQTLIGKYGKHDTDDMIISLSLWKQSKGEKTKDDGATVDAWFRNNAKKQKEQQQKKSFHQQEQDKMLNAMQEMYDECDDGNNAKGDIYNG